MPQVTIDGRELEFENGESIIQVATRAGIDQELNGARVACAGSHYEGCAIVEATAVDFRPVPEQQFYEAAVVERGCQHERRVASCRDIRIRAGREQ